MDHWNNKNDKNIIWLLKNQLAKKKYI